MSSSRNFRALFNAATHSAAPPPLRVSRLVASDVVAQFVEACDTAIDLAFDTPGATELLPGVDVAMPFELLKAYLLFLATEGLCCASDIEAGVCEAWFEGVTSHVWKLLGFAERAPAKMTVQLAFTLIGQREHQAPELRALIWAIGDLAASNVMPGLRS